VTLGGGSFGAGAGFAKPRCRGRDPRRGVGSAGQNLGRWPTGRLPSMIMAGRAGVLHSKGTWHIKLPTKKKCPC